MTHDDRPALTGLPSSTDDRPPRMAAQVGAGLASLAEAWLRDTLYCALGIFSLVVVVCGFTAADGAGHAVLGLIAGIVAVAIPTAMVVRKASVSRIWVALLVGALVDAAAIALILTS